MILLSFSSAFKYVIGLMLAILGYIPFEQTEKPVTLQTENIIQADSLQINQMNIVITDSIINLNRREVQVQLIPALKGEEAEN